MQVAAPALLYGVRFWLSICLALFIAFKLELPDAYWAGTTAGIVCNPILGASLRKGWYRGIGTVIGAVMSIVLAGAFPQSRAGFLIALTLWCALSGFCATLLRNFASYAAALAGYTAVIILGGQLGLVGGLSGQAFTPAVWRATEIIIGIVSAGIVLAGTDLGASRRRLALLFAGLSAQVAAGLLGAFRATPDQQAGSRLVRRALIQRATALETVTDQALGETTALRLHPRTLNEAGDGVFAALSAWRAIATHLERAGDDEAERAAVLEAIPEGLRSAPADPGYWSAEAATLRRDCLVGVRRLLALPASGPSARLIADRAAEGLLGIYRALTAVVLLEDPAAVEPRWAPTRWQVPDLLPAVLNAVRVAAVMGVASMIWILTAWPGGPLAIMFATITVVLFSPREDEALSAARGFTIGTGISLVLAAAIAFGVLPQVRSFAGFCFAIGIVLVPAGAMTAQPWQTGLFIAAATNFMPLLGPSNPMTYDPAGFYNTSLGIMGGVIIAAVMMSLIPPMSPQYRARRLLTLTLRDLRAVATGRRRMTIRAWEARVYARLMAMPADVDLLQGARMMAVLAVGTEIIRLRRLTARLGQLEQMDFAFAAIAAGDGEGAVAHLRRFDAQLAAALGDPQRRVVRQHARGAITAIVEALDQHAAFFDARATL
jgi:uncharacterized membrane protein YccC